MCIQSWLTGQCQSSNSNIMESRDCTARVFKYVTIISEIEKCEGIAQRGKMEESLTSDGDRKPSTTIGIPHLSALVEFGEETLQQHIYTRIWSRTFNLKYLKVYVSYKVYTVVSRFCHVSIQFRFNSILGKPSLF